MSEYFTIKNKNSDMSSRKKFIEHTDRVEGFLAAIIVMLATIGILKALLQTISQL